MTKYTIKPQMCRNKVSRVNFEFLSTFFNIQIVDTVQTAYKINQPNVGAVEQSCFITIYKNKRGMEPERVGKK